MAQDKAVISPDLEIQPGANPKQPNRLAFRDRPRGSLQQGFGDTAITPRLVDAVFGNGLPDLLIPEPDQSMATPPGYVMACAAKRRQGGKLQRQCLIPVRARHMIEIETAIDTPRPIHDPLRWGAPCQPVPLRTHSSCARPSLPRPCHKRGGKNPGGDIGMQRRIRVAIIYLHGPLREKLPGWQQAVL